MTSARNHGAMGSRYQASATVDGQPRQAVLFAPLEPTRRRSPDLSAYDRLDPPTPRAYGKSRVEVHIEGMDRLRAALDDLAAKINGAASSAAGFTVNVDPSMGPDQVAMGYRWPDGSIRPYAHKRSETFW